MSLHLFMVLAGVGHIALALGSLAVPYLLKWQNALRDAPVLIRQLFWTYGGYILSINLFFGILAIAMPDELLSGSPLASALTLFIAIYWIARLIIQLIWFDKSEIPDHRIYKIGEIGLLFLFIFFSAVFSWAALYNFNL